MEGIAESIREFLLDVLNMRDAVPGLTNDTPLISGGILNSLDLPRLLAFLEATYDVEIYFDEDKASLETVNTMAALIDAKMQARPALE